MRVQSPRPLRNGGWAHPLNGEKLPIGRAARKVTNEDFDPKRIYAIWANWLAHTEPARLLFLSDLIHVSYEALLNLRMVWSKEHEAWGFPMFNDARKISGIRLRNERGDKWAVRGGKNGLFVPRQNAQRCCYICEGPTDTAALLSIGLFAIGRASCNEGATQLAALLPRLGVREAVIAGDHDTDKELPDGRRYNPGVDGSVRLSDKLPVPNCVWIPPTKDVREFVRAGGTAQDIESMIKAFRWKQPTTSANSR